MTTQYQAIILGGGPAGAAAAALLAGSGRRVALIDHRRPAMPSGDFDPRVVAVSPGGRNVLLAAGGWERMPEERICAYTNMHVEAGGGHTDFQAADHGLTELGWIAELPAVQAGLWRAMRSAGMVELLAPQKVVAARLGRPLPELELDDGRTLRAELLVAADGVRSPLRRQAGIGVEQWHYNQWAVVCHLELEREPGFGIRFAHPSPVPPSHAKAGAIAWQRFAGDGPLALLPLPEGRLSLVWSLPEAKAGDIVSLEDAEFLKRLAGACGEPFGPFRSATRRLSFPLVRQRAQSLTSNRLALVGDAGRTVHPLAGQGMNLGLMDAAALAECLEGWQPGQDPAHRLDRYRRWRTGAGELMAGGIHSINELFAVRSPLLGQIRGLGLMLTGLAWPARELFVRRACGLDSDSPTLARGDGSRKDA